MAVPEGAGLFVLAWGITMIVCQLGSLFIGTATIG